MGLWVAITYEQVYASFIGNTALLDAVNSLETGPYEQPNEQ